MKSYSSYLKQFFPSIKDLYHSFTFLSNIFPFFFIQRAYVHSLVNFLSLSAPDYIRDWLQELLDDSRIPCIYSSLLDTNKPCMHMATWFCWRLHLDCSLLTWGYTCPTCRPQCLILTCSVAHMFPLEATIKQ